MSSLLAPRPPGWRMREDQGQGSLFGGEALAQPMPTPTPTPFPRRERPPAPEAPVDAAPLAPLREAPDAGEERAAQAQGAPLAGPTLDDAMSRAWEGLVAGVPAACPVCHGEIEPALAGRLVGHCSTCDITLD